MCVLLQENANFVRNYMPSQLRVGTNSTFGL